MPERPAARRLDHADRGTAVTSSMVDLTCVVCGMASPHELVLVGRLLQSTRCTNCHHVIRHEQRDLMAAYLRDLEHRVLTKPRRLLQRARREPLTFAREFPAAVLRQPGKLASEVWVLLRRR